MSENLRNNFEKLVWLFQYLQITTIFPRSSSAILSAFVAMVAARIAPERHTMVDLG
jgi:hypothetical protein